MLVLQSQHFCLALASLIAFYTVVYFKMQYKGIFYTVVYFKMLKLQQVSNSDAVKC